MSHGAHEGSIWRRWIGLLCMALCWPAVVQAVHFDVEIRVDRSAPASSRLSTAFYGDIDLGGALPIDAQTGFKIYPGYFGDLEGGPYLTDDPGFQAFAGALSPGDLIHFRALGTLAWWNPATGRWGPAPAGVSVTLFGGVPNEVIVGYTENPAAWRDAYSFYEAGTRFTASGVEGPLTALIDDARSNGAFHAHLDWKIRAAQGVPPAGAYLVTIEIWSPTLAGGRQKYLPAEPIHVVFERGISEAQLRQAIQARISPPADVPPAASTRRPPRAPWGAPAAQPWSLQP